MQIQLTLPQWLVQLQSELPTAIEDETERMRTIIQCSRLNFEHDTGGPFAAGVFEKETGKIVAIGVNLVVPQSCSSAHAEIVTLSLAQQKLGNFDLGAPGMPHHQLVVNGQPCAMCFGSIPWSGVRSLVCAASGQQVEAITGFDEGPVHPNWVEQLEQRGIAVTQGLLAEEACDAFRDFKKAGRKVYNGRGKAE